MSDEHDYRTPAEIADQAADEARIRVVLDRARGDAAMLIAAMALGEPPDVVELWIDRVWDGLRDSLDGEQRLAAIVLLITPGAHQAADRLTRIEHTP